MKNFILILFTLLGLSTTNAQFFSYGIKGGINQNSNGDLTDVEGLIDDIKIESDEELGYHFGVFAEFDLPLWIYLRPELNYTHTESSYEEGGYISTLEMDKVEVPLLAGFRILHWGRIFAGPVFSYIIDTDLSNSELYENVKNVEFDDLGVNGQIGLGLELFKKLGVDIRYEIGLTDTNALFEGDLNGYPGTSESQVKIDTSPEQVILSFYYKF